MYGRYLRVNLSTGESSRETIRQDWVDDFIGASGLAARMLYEELDKGHDPLDADSPLLFITGPLSGTNGPTTGRFTICGRSPQTGWWGEANIGGYVGTELRKAGYDAVWITGRAERPVYLWIEDEVVEIRAAGHLWGRADTYETQTLIRAELGRGQARVACIGLAGEIQVKLAGILADNGRLAARSGMGALMGSKNLKALAVRGSGSIPLARPEIYKTLRLAANKRLLEQNMTEVMRATGSAGGAEYLQYLGDFPQKYWTQTGRSFAEKISGAAMAESILTGTSACQGCVISCGRVVQVEGGAFHTAGKVKGPEYETISAIGGQLMIDDLGAITALGGLCDRLGLDSISAGNILALATLLFEQGKLTTTDTDGLILRWGDPAPAFELLGKMARREGIGSLMAEGSRALAAACGDAGLAVQVNGLDVAMHDPRAFGGQALSYVLSPRGACHNQSDYFNVELGGSLEEIGIPFTDRLQDHGKAAVIARHQHWRSVCNSLTTCYFAVVSPFEILDLLNAASGRDWDIGNLLKAGERIWNMKRLYNLRLGWTPAGEKLPRLLLQPLPDSGQQGHVPDVDAMLDEYYAASGWERTTGWPTPQKLAELGLDSLVIQG